MKEFIGGRIGAADRVGELVGRPIDLLQIKELCF